MKVRVGVQMLRQGHAVCVIFAAGGSEETTKDGGFQAGGGGAQRIGEPPCAKSLSRTLLSPPRTYHGTKQTTRPRRRMVRAAGLDASAPSRPISMADCVDEEGGEADNRGEGGGGGVLSCG